VQPQCGGDRHFEVIGEDGHLSRLCCSPRPSRNLIAWTASRSQIAGTSSSLMGARWTANHSGAMVQRERVSSDAEKRKVSQVSVREAHSPPEASTAFVGV
jgi:hypothetical protein